jgi:hypothetical protein
VGRITGTLEISSPNMSAARQTAVNAMIFLRERGSVMSKFSAVRAQAGNDLFL